MLDLTGLYAVPLALLMIGLWAHVSMKRSETGTSILDGGHMELAERIRRHGNLIETAPMALLLMAFSEAGGTAPVWSHAAGLCLLAGRILHPFGLHHDRPASPLRIIAGLLTWISMLISMTNIVVNHWLG
ncbi:hypothetical protein DFR52_10170 [Hoeflea marina]|uniref:MAPEG family protein n=1 Tax=Hoeflea marina TaxID=274592 RepID=A0A317PVD8_9HYPH|nr:MAPEG family protein [Hoeflea marina]PWW03390.1 hypothetical protein DFR52_10170 [Hoeflea marina]